MPSHEEDTISIPDIMYTINTQITAHPNHIHIICGDLNKDIALIGKQNEHGTIPPQEEDFRWRMYTDNLLLSYIPTNTTYSRQGGLNYTNTNLINNFYTNTQHATIYTSITLQEQNLNFDHLPIILKIPPNTLIARVMQPPPSLITKNMNPIPQENLDKFKTIFFEKIAIRVNEITTLLSNNYLTNEQWHTTCTQMDNITHKISRTIKETCNATLIPTLTNITNQQGGYLPKKLQKKWKKHIATYNLVRKTIYIIKTQ